MAVLLRLWNEYGAAFAQSMGLAGVAAYLTYMYTGTLGLCWDYKDYAFVFAVGASVFLHRIRIKSYIEHDPSVRLNEKIDSAYPLEVVENYHGQPLALQHNQIIVLLFFATWCKGSRTALKKMEEVIETYGNNVRVLAVTQETKQELDTYNSSGQKNSSYKPLNGFPFSIAIESGRLAIEYQLRYKVNTLPHCYVIGKDDSMFWHGHPLGLFEDAIRRTLIYDFEGQAERVKKAKEIENNTDKKTK